MNPDDGITITIHLDDPPKGRGIGPRVDLVELSKNQPELADEILGSGVAARLRRERRLPPVMVNTSPSATVPSSLYFIK